MSLYDSDDFWAPGISEYEKRELIPIKQRCEVCEGMGTQQWRNSDFGSDQGKDWRTCWSCQGTGKQKEQP